MLVLERLYLHAHRGAVRATAELPGGVRVEATIPPHTARRALSALGLAPPPSNGRMLPRAAPRALPDAQPITDDDLLDVVDLYCAARSGDAKARATVTSLLRSSDPQAVKVARLLDLAARIDKERKTDPELRELIACFPGRYGEAIAGLLLALRSYDDARGRTATNAGPAG